MDAMCMAVPTWFYEALVQFEDKPLILEPFQRTYLLDDSKFKITNKTRQAGGSVQLALAKLYKAYVTKSYRCDIVSINLKEASDKIKYIRGFWETIPKKYQIPLEIDNALSIGFHKGKAHVSTINSLAASSGIRGGRKDIVFDEFAHIPKADELLEAAMPAIMNGNLGVDIVSTPRGAHNMFGKIWLNEPDVRGERPYRFFSRHQFIWLDVGRFVTDYDAVQAAWNACGQDFSKMEDLVDEYGSDTLQMIRSMNTWDYFLQEFCGQFLDDSHALFSYELLDKVFKSPIGELEDQTEEEYLEPWMARDSDGEMQPLGRPEHNTNYLMMGVDFGKSDESSDKTSIQILEKTKDGRLKHRFSKNLQKTKFPNYIDQAQEIARIAQIFGINCMYADQTGVGEGIIPLIKKFAPGIRIEGIVFNNQLKLEMVMNLKRMMEDNNIWLMYEDRQLYSEIHGMRGTLLPASGKTRYHGEPHDDMFWALALAAKEGTYRHFAAYTIDDLLKGLV